MDEGVVIELMRMTLTTITLLLAPILITIVVVGLLTSVAQTVTQLRDQSITFVPKLVAAGIVMLVLWPWYMQMMGKYMATIFSLMGSTSP